MRARRRLGAAAAVVGLMAVSCSSTSGTAGTADGATPAPGGPPTTEALLIGPDPAAEDAPPTASSSDGAPVDPPSEDAPTATTIVPEVPVPALEPEPVEGSWSVERVVAPTGSGGVIDIHRPIDGEGWPLVVLYGDVGIDSTAYSDLATALAERGTVVAVSTFDAEQPPVASACALSAATVWAEANRADPSRLTLVGIGTGAIAATGEALGGAWTNWSTASCTAGAPPIEPSALVTIDGTFGYYDGDDPTAEGLRPIDQVAGGNPYLRIGVLQGEDLDEVGEQLVGRLVDDGYDLTMTELYSPVADVLDGDLGEIVDALFETVESGSAS